MRFFLPVLFALALSAADDDWMAMGTGATVHNSGNSVSMDYKLAPGKPGLAIRQTPAGKLAGMTHLQFRVKSDIDTMLAVLLSEIKPGGDYIAIFWSPKDQWQQIDLAPADFTLNDGPKDPKDPNGRLDVDQVQGVAIFDAGQFFKSGATGGDHKLEWENFRVVTESAESGRKGIVIDDFHRNFLTWFSPGAGALALSKSGNPLNKPALEFRYAQEPDKFAAVIHALGQLDLRGARELSFDVASVNDADMILSLEGRKVDGRAPRYNHDFTITAGQTGHMSIPFSEFTLADDSPPDPDGHLEIGKIRTITLVDIIGIAEGVKAQNTLWVTDMRAK